MRIMGLGVPEITLITIMLVVPIILVVGAILLVRYFIRYNARVKTEAAQAARRAEAQQSDIDRSIINDL